LETHQAGIKKRGRIMHFQKTILLLTIFSLMMAVPAFSKQGKNNVSGKVKVSGDDASVWIELRADGAKNSLAASGSLRCWQNNKSKETSADVVYMKVDGSYGWLAGKCTRDSGNLTGRWFFMAVHDGGTPGHLADQLWENLEKPANNKSIETGDIVVVPCN
jgi:hypothetical protein